VTFFSPNDILGLRRPKNIKFGTKVASGMTMMHTLRFLESSLIVSNFAKNAKRRTKTPIFQPSMT